MPLAFAPEQAVVVVRTSQPFDDLAAGLENHGYEREGDLLVADDPVARVGVTVLLPAGDDVIVLAQSPEVARAVAAGEGDGPSLAETLDTVEAPLRMAVGTSEDSDSCLETVVAGWQPDSSEGEIVVTVTDEDDADSEAFLPDDSRLARDVDVDQPEVDGRIVRVSYRYDGPGSPFGFLFNDTPAGSLYRCR